VLFPSGWRPVGGIFFVVMTDAPHISQVPDVSLISFIASPTVLPIRRNRDCPNFKLRNKVTNAAMQN
jgi:hypothetical protein